MFQVYLHSNIHSFVSKCIRRGDGVQAANSLTSITWHLKYTHRCFQMWGVNPSGQIVQTFGQTEQLRMHPRQDVLYTKIVRKQSHSTYPHSSPCELFNNSWRILFWWWISQLRGKVRWDDRRKAEVGYTERQCAEPVWSAVETASKASATSAAAGTRYVHLAR